MAIVRTSVVKRLHLFGAVAVAALAGSAVSAAPLAISDAPVFLNATNAQPLVMLALSNDEQLYHKAYTDFDDVDGDNVMDTTYKDTISYYGYFDSSKCYSYSGDTPTGLFVPAAAAAGTNGHACNTVAAGRWSGNFLNWATMARMDALRKVLFGGYRSTDSATSTVLERVHIPSDNHAWTKFYSAADMGNYTPYDIATYAAGITMCNVTPPDASNDPSETTTTSPRLRIAKGQWTEWAAQESKQCLWTSATSPEFTPNASNPNSTPSISNGDNLAEFTLRVQVCISTLLGNEKCKAYGTSLKPVGLLQDFADADQDRIRFGLMTGTYGKRKSGGELRKNVARFSDEVSSTDGTFTGSAGIVKSINLMRISRYSYSDPGYGGTDGCPSGQNSWSNGKCSDWGNPVGEIFLESLRYFVAGMSANSAFTSDDTPWIANLTSPAWVNPYGAAATSAPFGGGAGVCAKPNVLAISTGVTSFDNDEYSKASDIPGLSTTSLSAKTDSVGTNEGINGNQWYVGSLTGGSAGDVCTSTTVSNLSSVTGICPEAAGLQGSFQVAGLAYYAHTHSMQSVSGKATPVVDTYAVSLAPPTPSLKIPVGSSTVTVIPAGYNKRDNNAMQLINFRVVSQAADNSSGLYFMNFENAPAGSDYDNDMKGYLAYAVSGGNVNIAMWLTGSSAGATQWMGYTITGVSDPGTYYLLSNTNSLTANDSTSKFFSQTVLQINTACPTLSYVAGSTTYCQYNVADTGGTVQSRYMRGARAHTPGTASTGLLKQPLWYAAKYGGFKDVNSDGKPNTTAEWDSNGDGVPDNYFFVTNASLLENQLSNAFNTILSHAGSASSASVNSGSISSSTRVYQAKFDTDAWGGQLLAFTIATDGTIGSSPSWDASQKFPTTRNILTPNRSGALMPFQWTNLGAVSTGGSTTMQNLLYPDGVTATVAQNRLNYLRGDQSLEQSNAGPFRNRDSPLGDIVDSSPVYVATPGFRYRDNMESVTYSSFRTNKASRKAVVYVGANDGLLHAFDASTNTDGTDTASAGQEVFAFIPSVVLPNLYGLTKPNYTHQYYEDGTPAVVDAFFSSDTAWHTVLVSGLNKGGREVFALDVTDPTALTEAASTNYLLWEFTNANDADLGYTYSRPAVVKMHDGKWVAIFGNGYNSSGSNSAGVASTGHAVLFIVDVRTGALIKKIDTQVGSTGTPNGLATPAVVDVDGDGIVDYVYAGDLQGNMWKFDVTSSAEGSWGIPYLDASSKPKPLFTANDGSASPGPYAQPITERPQVGFGPAGTGLIVLFGTGKFIEASDRTVDTANPRPQTFYGIFDPNTGVTATDTVSGRGKLTQQTILAEQSVTVTGTDASGNPVTYPYNVRVVSSNSIDLTSTTGRGWYLDLVSPHGYEAEKSISDPILRNGKVIFTTTIPDADPCAYGGRSWLMEMDAMTGSDLSYSPFDLNYDKKFNDQDYVTVTINGATVQVPASGLQSTGGLITKPGIVSSQDSEYAISPDTSGTLEEHRQNPGPGAVGRQSWRQIH